MPTNPPRQASGGGESAGQGVPASSVVPTWLLKAKVTAAALPDRYVRRAPLLERLEGVLARRLTALRAPAGFGKTTVLADIARDTQAQGRVVGWIALDDDDTPDVFGSYLIYAFEQAGLDLGLLDGQDTSPSSPGVHRMGLLARAIEAHASPCLLVLDEVDRLPRGTLRSLDLLLQHAPSNLHVAMAYRSDPALDLATHLLDGEAIVVGTEEFRFSRADIAQFFDGALSRRELAAVEERTSGWPVALMVHRHLRGDEGGKLGTNTAIFTENYIGVRLLRDLSAEDRGLLLDLAVFDPIDADVVDDVLRSSEARTRITGLQPLDGLLPPLDEDHAVRRMHPLLREYCLERLAVEDPPRKRSLHKLIALALVGRGRLAPALPHARAAGDSRPVCELVERFGACQLWLREGPAQLMSAGRFLLPDLTASYPRLELLRCVFLRLSSKLEEAHALFEAVARRTGDFARDRDGGDDEALAVDRLFTRAVLAGGVDSPSESEIAALRTAYGGEVEGDRRSRLIAGAGQAWLCVACHDRADFEESRRHGLQAQRYFGADQRYGAVVVDLYQGMSALAQGRVHDAAASYTRARQGIRKFFPSDSCLALSVDVLTTELDLERNRATASQRRALKSLTELPAVWVDIQTAALAVSAELTGELDGAEAAVERLREVVDDVRAKGVAGLSHNLSALLAHYLVEAGRPDEAAQVWQDQGLPCTARDLLVLERQSWRAMETQSCARVRLLAAAGEWAAAERLVGSLCATASDHGLTRTRLRALALSMLVAHQAGQPDRARARLAEFLRLTREADYVRPLVRHGQVSRTVLQQLLDADPDEELRPAAESMLASLDRPAGATTATFSLRELDVLAEVRQGLRNGQIANRLGMTEDGVRYHLKSIYRKTGASSRKEAVSYAHSLGVLP